MAYTRVTLPTVLDLRNKFCDDVRRLKIRAGVTAPNVAAGSETAIKGEAVASATFQIMAEVAATQDACMPDKAEWNDQVDDLPRLALVWKGLEPSQGSGATGNVDADCTGTVVYPAGLEWKTADNLRYQVVSSTSATSGTPIPVVGVDVGTRTNKSAGTIGTWTSPPSGSNSTAQVSLGGLTNGTDPDDAARLRLRLQDALRHPAASGSWSHYAQWAESIASVEKAFVYPAVEGPATVHVAFTVAASADNLTGAYTRQAPAALVSMVANKVVAEDPEHADVTVQPVNDENANLSLKVQIPLHPTDGGTGNGWVDPVASQWPIYYAASPYATYVTASPTVPTVLRINVLDASNIPINGAFFAVWSVTKKKFIHCRVHTTTAPSLVAGTTYDVTLQSPVDITAISSADWVSPDAYKLDDYGVTLAEQFAGLGPGQKTATAALLPRSYRHPLITESWPSQFTSNHIGQLGILHPEVSHVDVMYPLAANMPISPSTSMTVADYANILVLGKLAIYKK